MIFDTIRTHIISNFYQSGILSALFMTFAREQQNRCDWPSTGDSLRINVIVKTKTKLKIRI
ncbi:hypothetical protein UA45_09040 [Morganella morganii]|uniref:Uncharacterized protein n=1 Tax=Morganella morganii TaxID=582 RepID=A0A0D8L7Z5_MORMO|nr:hypothetical protein UA45_09040 [Morganella morganii]